MPARLYATTLIALAAASAAHAQWDPANGDWGKTDPTDLRVMTWNVQDGICSSATKSDTFANWNAIARVITALDPDVLILQECGDNSGNGTGSSGDSAANLLTTCELLIHGGADPFKGGTVGAYCQLWNPAFDLPYIFVSNESDGFNRDIIMSKYPFADLNGNGEAYKNDFVALPDASAWDTYTDGGIRGFQWAQVDLPDATYAGDIVVGNSHLKSGGDSSDYTQRLEAAKTIAYFVQYYWNGNGTGAVDPSNVIFQPADGALADPNTPVVWGGDWNNRRESKGPVEWMYQAQVFGGTADGPDRDGTDCTADYATQPISGETGTQGGSSKIDFICWQDSIATARREFIFRSSGVGMSAANNPFPVTGFPISATSASSVASDHRPVIVDFILPAAADPCPCDLDPNGTLNLDDIDAFIAAFTGGDLLADLDNNGSLNLDDIDAFIACFTGGCP